MIIERQCLECHKLFEVEIEEGKRCRIRYCPVCSVKRQLAGAKKGKSKKGDK